MTFLGRRFTQSHLYVQVLRIVLKKVLGPKRLYRMMMSASEDCMVRIDLRCGSYV